MSEQTDEENKSLAQTRSMSSFPVWVDDSHLDCQWLELKTGVKYVSSCLVQDISNTTRRGSVPREGATLSNHNDTAPDESERPRRLVLKQVPPNAPPLQSSVGSRP
jgi:hypothetical protein